MRLFLGAVALCILSTSADAQKAPAAPTTRSGIYNQEQAGRGADVFAGYCKSCHTLESHSGAQFRAKWHGKRLSELYEYMRDQMPKNDPASLSEQEYADVLAYVLKLNRMPSGKVELPPDPAKLRSIRIVTSTTVRKEK